MHLTPFPTVSCCLSTSSSSCICLTAYGMLGAHTFHTYSLHGYTIPHVQLLPEHLQLLLRRLVAVTQPRQLRLQRLQLALANHLAKLRGRGCEGHVPGRFTVGRKQLCTLRWRIQQDTGMFCPARLQRLQTPPRPRPPPCEAARPLRFAIRTRDTKT